MLKTLIETALWEMFMFRIAPLAVLWFAAMPATATLAQGSVLVVDPGGGGAFTEIQDAVDAAVDGDTILLRHGTYVDLSFPFEPVIIDGKSLVVAATQSGAVLLNGLHLYVRNLSAGQTVTLSGLQVQDAAVVLDNNVGAVLLQECCMALYFDLSLYEPLQLIDCNAV